MDSEEFGGWIHRNQTQTVENRKNGLYDQTNQGVRMHFLHELSAEEYEEFREELNAPWPEDEDNGWLLTQKQL